VSLHFDVEVLIRGQDVWRPPSPDSEGEEACRWGLRWPNRSREIFEQINQPGLHYQLTGLNNREFSRHWQGISCNIAPNIKNFEFTHRASFLLVSGVLDRMLGISVYTTICHSRFNVCQERGKNCLKEKKCFSSGPRPNKHHPHWNSRHLLMNISAACWANSTTIASSKNLLMLTSSLIPWNIELK